MYILHKKCPLSFSKSLVGGCTYKTLRVCYNRDNKTDKGEKTMNEQTSPKINSQLKGKTAMPEYHIHSFMYNLGLKPAAFLIYATLYSFTIGERGLYHGSQKYLAESLEIGVRTLQNSIKELFLRGLIEKCVSEDGKYKGIRCVGGIKAGKGEAAPVVSPQRQREFLVELNRKIEERKAEEREREAAEKARKEQERAEQLRRVDEIIARVNAKIAAGDIEKHRSEPEPAESEEADESFFEAAEIPKMSEHEKNTLIMMRKYEPLGDRRRFLSFGKEGKVKMTEPQYKRLLDKLPTEELLPYLTKLETMLDENIKTGRKPPHSHYHTLKSWIEHDLSE